MTVSTTISRADYTGNGVTVTFTVPFYFLDQTHLTVLRTQISTGVTTALALTTNYTVAGAGNLAGGSITCTVAPTADQRLSILRNVPLTQLTDYVENDPFPAASHERALDQLTMEMQQVSEAIGRALTLSPATVGVSASLPTPAANRLIGWDTNATALQNVDPSSLLTIAGSSGFTYQSFSGTGAQTSFALSANPGALGNLEVFVSGVRQSPVDDYTVSGTTLTFVPAATPPAGTSNILARWGQTLGIGVPADTSVSTAKLVDANVTTAKLADNNVTVAKLQQVATATFLGRSTAGTGNVEVLTAAQAAALLPVAQLQPISASVAANAITISASALSLDFRSTTLGSGTVTRVSGTPSNLVVPSGATLGTVNAVQSDIAVLALNNAGTIELAVVNMSGAINLSEQGVISTTAISAGATSSTVVYSTTARTNVAYRLLGIVRSTQATAGTWATSPSLIQGAGGQAVVAMAMNAVGDAPMHACRAWVNFNGTGTVAIRASGNVSSITDNGVGDYTVNFTTAMPDTNYAQQVSAWDNGTTALVGLGANTGSTNSAGTSSFRFGLRTGAGTASDMTNISVSIFR